MSHSSSSNPWLPMGHPSPSARVRLFCFPFAGGAASVFRTWGRQLGPEIDVCPVQLPGRERRIREPPFRKLCDVIEALYPALEADLERPFAFFGHSLGSVIAFELARRVAEEKGVEPVYFFPSARNAPPWPIREVPMHTMEQKEFRENLRRMGGTPPEVLEHEELMSLLEPLVRADLEVNETYRFLPKRQLTCPFTAFAGEHDQEASLDGVKAWREMSSGPFSIEIFPQGHFFLQEVEAEILATIRRSLQS